jgi:hypothetical protein
MLQKPSWAYRHDAGPAAVGGDGLMSRGPWTFKPTNITKAIKAAVKAGLTVGRVEIAPDGKIIVIAGTPGQEQNSEIEETSADLRRLL